MKVRLKKTGEVYNIADYATIAIDSHDSWGNPIELKPEDVEFVQEWTEDEHWRDVRERAAIAALQGTIITLHDKGKNLGQIAEFAVDCADSLIEELKRIKPTKL